MHVPANSVVKVVDPDLALGLGEVLGHEERLARGDVDTESVENRLDLRALHEPVATLVVWLEVLPHVHVVRLAVFGDLFQHGFAVWVHRRNNPRHGRAPLAPRRRHLLLVLHLEHIAERASRLVGRHPVKLVVPTLLELGLYLRHLAALVYAVYARDGCRSQLARLQVTQHP
eukprot:CAMPEP_0182582520 /NCGR_PEP_ID=MMETSP1324-20130603/52835_1 /TAXON_ID=236786 /ORGANISM="Florenciella sp., Strain RCC1587" /LENGTH=171 /DNA_ID=CAMNT_0024798995 /DNA_START=239 /DNA_END=750 /DNA_ORIENTATION=+